MRLRPAAAIVFGSSAAILVIEIAAGRLMAPYVGVSLETFTAVIGVVLAGIAAGAGVGGRLADRHDPARLLGPSLAVGGALTWLSVPVVLGLGPSLGPDPVEIVLLTTLAFFLPAAVLSAATPMVVKLRLASLEETGSVVGGLSAAGTIGGLAGTFVTGFVLVATIGTRAILLGTGALLVVAGAAIHWWLARRPPTATSGALVAVAALAVFGFEPGCEYETEYACANVVEDSATRRSLYLDRTRHAQIDIADPTFLGSRYVRLFADVADAVPADPLDVLHVGGGGFVFPRHLLHVRPGSTHHVIEIDPGVVDIARDRLALEPGPDLVVDVGDARTALPDLATGRFDLVVGDAFSGDTVPWHLTTVEFAEEIDRVLRPGGIYVLNVIDGEGSGFARAEIATLRSVFDHVELILPNEAPPSGLRNQVVVASDAPIPDLDVDPDDGVVVSAGFLDDYVGGARRLTDDFAPVDQLLPARD